jgi:galactosylceramidase
MKLNTYLLIVLFTMVSGVGLAQEQNISIIDKHSGSIFGGIGALSAGASSKLLMDYPEPYRSQIFDFLFKPKFGASLQHIKVEIGGDINSTDGTETSHAHTRDEFLNPKPEYFQRGYEWLVLKEAKKRNPQIFTDCLEWGCPGWIGDGIFYSQDNADYIVSFLKGAKQFHNICFDYTGIWNERQYDKEWIKLLRKALDNNGLSDVKIIAADIFDWKISDDMVNDPELNNAVYAISSHYADREKWWAKPVYGSTENAQKLNKPIHNSEAGPWKGDWDAFEYLIKLYNRSYIVGKVTNIVTWSLITSYYDNLSLPNSGLMMAKTPWSGYYEVQPAIWAVAHTTQFAEPGWKYVDSGCGFLKKGSYVTLKSPDEKEYSIIIETADTTGAQVVTFDLDSKLSGKTLHVWKTTRGKCEFEKQPDVKIRNNKFTIQLEGKSAYSITTTTGQTKGNYPIPENKSFPFPYQAGFEDGTIGQLPKYFMDQAGVFEVQPRSDGIGKCLKQVVKQQGIEWEVGQNTAVETVLGDTLWTDYEVQTDVYIPENTGYAKLLGRVMEMKRGGDYPEGYTFVINTGNRWSLFAGTLEIAKGETSFPAFAWHHLSMKLNGNTITVSVNKKEIIAIKNAKYTHGLAGLGSGFNQAEFDNFEVK